MEVVMLTVLRKDPLGRRDPRWAMAVTAVDSNNAKAMIMEV
jgi:hypothetical protein